MATALILSCAEKKAYLGVMKGHKGVVWQYCRHLEGYMHERLDLPPPLQSISIQYIKSVYL